MKVAVGGIIVAVAVVVALGGMLVQVGVAEGINCVGVGASVKVGIMAVGKGVEDGITGTTGINGKYKDCPVTINVELPMQLAC